MPKRALFKQENGPLSPLTWGNIFSAGTLTSSMIIWPVMEALKESFPYELGEEILLFLGQTIRAFLFLGWIPECHHFRLWPRQQRHQQWGNWWSKFLCHWGYSNCLTFLHLTSCHQDWSHNQVQWFQNTQLILQKLV